MNQPELFTAEQLRDKGIKQAVDHANNKIEKWSDKAYEFLLKYMLDHNQFMVEEVREASEEIVPPPPSKRAWGGIIRKAANAKLIKRIDCRIVKNPKAHCAIASVWKVL